MRFTAPSAWWARIRSSSAATISGEAEPAYSGLYLKPLYGAGLWLEVMTTPPPALRSSTE
jgi:hypothetical protein